MTTHEGVQTSLDAFCDGHLTAVQLVFTQCSAICPIQGALFAQAQPLAKGKLPAHVQWLSLSIDPLSDTPAALRKWLKQFNAGRHWTAASPRPQDLHAIRERLEQGGEAQGNTVDAHPGQVYIIDAKHQLVYRTPAMPSPGQLVDTLAALVNAPQPAPRASR